MKNPIENYVGMKEVTTYLGKHENTVLRWIAETRVGQNNFPYYQDASHGRLSFKISEIDGWRRNKRIEREIQARKERLRCFSIAKS